MTLSKEAKEIKEGKADVDWDGFYIRLELLINEFGIDSYMGKTDFMIARKIIELIAPETAENLG